MNIFKSKILGRVLHNTIAPFPQNINQTVQSQTPGALDLNSNPNPNVLTCRFNPSSSVTAGIAAGQPLKLIDLGGSDVDGLPVVDVATADTDVIIGVAIQSPRFGLTLPGYSVQVATFGTAVWMVAGSNMNRGQTVVADHLNPGKVLTTVAKTGYVLGVLIDKATSAGLARVMIIANGTIFSGQVSS